MIHTMMSVSGGAPDCGLVCYTVPLCLNFSGMKGLAEFKAERAVLEPESVESWTLGGSERYRRASPGALVRSNI